MSSVKSPALTSSDQEALQSAVIEVCENAYFWQRLFSGSACRLRRQKLERCGLWIIECRGQRGDQSRECIDDFVEIPKHLRHAASQLGALLRRFVQPALAGIDQRQAVVNHSLVGLYRQYFFIYRHRRTQFTVVVVLARALEQLHDVVDRGALPGPSAARRTVRRRGAALLAIHGRIPGREARCWWIG